jgi:hypothetical protein
MRARVSWVVFIGPTIEQWQPGGWSGIERSTKECHRLAICGLLGLRRHLFGVQTKPKDPCLFVRTMRAIVQHYNAPSRRRPDSRIARCGHQSTAFLPNIPSRRQCNDPAIRALLWVTSWWHRHNSSVPSLLRIPPPRNHYQSTVRTLFGGAFRGACN